MKFIDLNKYIIKEIFSYLDTKKTLNFVKNSKKLMSKLNITKYTYQKKYFNLIISPALLENQWILVKNNIYDKKTLQKLKLDWENETTSIFKERHFFNFDKRQKKLPSVPEKIKTLNITLNNVKNLNQNMPNLIELNLSDLNNFELPCSILFNLESLSLTNISNLKFLTNQNNISLNKLKHFYIDNISFKENTQLKISLDNLKYLDIRFNEKEGEEKEGERNSGFIKNNVFKQLMQLFNFNFCSNFIIDKKLEDEEILSYKIEELKIIFKNAQFNFEEKYLNNLDYFNFEISYGYHTGSGAMDEDEEFIYKYFFSKTKDNNYIFKTIYTFNIDSEFEECRYILTKNDLRYCHKKNYNDYYFNKKDYIIKGWGSFNEEFDPENLNSFNILSNEDDNSEPFLRLFESFKKNNDSLETIYLDALDLNALPKFIDIIKNFSILKCFIVKKYCILTTKQLIQLLTNLSKLKYLFLIELNFEDELKISEDDKTKICKLFPDISISIKPKKSFIKWNNNNVKFNIK